MRIVRSGLSATASPCRRTAALSPPRGRVLGRLEDVVGLLGRGLAEEVVGEVAARRMDVEERALLGRLVLVAVDHSLGDDERGADALGVALVAQLERIVALEHDEAIDMLSVQMPPRPALRARAHVGEDEVREVGEHVDGRLGYVHKGLAGARHARRSLRRSAQAVERALQALVELDLGLPAERFTRARGVERDVLHLARALGGVLGLEAAVGVRVDDLDDVEHALLLAEADVDRPGGVRFGGAQVGVHNVLDEHVVARLLAVPKIVAVPPSSSLPQKIAITPASPSGSWRGP